MTTEERAELRALCERASGGPWRACGCERGGCDCRQVWSLDADAPVVAALSADDEAYTGGEGVTKEQAKANAAFIAATRTALPRLLDALERAERTVEGLRDTAVAAIEAGEWIVDGARDPALDAPATPPDQGSSTTDTLRRVGVHLATKPLARPDRQRATPVQEPSALDRIRRWLASVPIRITKHGVSRLDFEARGRGERR